MALEHFFGNVAGESHYNADGTDRQDIIPRCRVGEPLILAHEPDHPHDINAIRVLRANGQQIGYLERELAGQVVSRSAKGTKFHAAIAGIGRPQRSAPYGVALLIIVDNDDGSAAEIAQYARAVLRRDRPIATTVAPTVPARSVVDWLLIGTMIAIMIAAIAAVVANGSFSPFN